MVAEKKIVTFFMVFVLLFTLSCPSFAYASQDNSSQSRQVLKKDEEGENKIAISEGYLLSDNIFCGDNLVVYLKYTGYVFSNQQPSFVIKGFDSSAVLLNGKVVNQGTDWLIVECDTSKLNYGSYQIDEILLDETCWHDLGSCDLSFNVQKGEKAGFNNEEIGTEETNNQGSIDDEADFVEATPVDKTAPKPQVDSVRNGTVTLSWEPIEGATKYAISSQNPGVNYSLDCTDTTYTVSNLANGKEYSFLVQAYVDGTWSTYSEANYVKATPEGPTKPTPKVTSTGNGKVTLSWDAVSGATKYAISSQNPGVNYSLNFTGTSYTVTGLTNGKTYQFLVQAYVDGKWSAYSEADFVEATPVDKTAPKPQVDSVGNGTVTLSWEPIEGATEYAIAEHINNSYKTYTLNCKTTTYTISDLANGYEHEFLVQAKVNGKWSSYSEYDHVKATPEGPIKPSIVAVNEIGPPTVTWEKIPGATKYDVTVFGPTVKNYASEANSVKLTGLTRGVPYKCYVRAYIPFIGGWTAITDEDFFSFTLGTVNAPKPQVDSVGNGTVTLSWEPVEGATKYAISSQNPGVNYSLECLDTTYTISNLTNGKEYNFLIQAYVNGVWTAYTPNNYIKATPINDLIPRPIIVNTEGNSVTLSWEPIDGATKYAISSQNPGVNYSLDCTDTTYTVSNLANGKEYSFLVQAYIDGEWTSYGPGVYVTVSFVDKTAPKPQVDSVGNGTVTLSWEPIEGATEYAIAEHINNSYKTYTLNCKTTTYTISDLANGYEHEFLVQAKVNGKWSDYGPLNHVRATPHGVVSPSPKAVAGNRSAKITWEKVPGATKYAIAIKTSSGYKTYTLGCTGTSYTISGLRSGTTYQVLVQAFCYGQWSPYSEADLVSVTPYGPIYTYEQEAMLNRINGYSSGTSWLLAVDRSTHKVGVFRGSTNNWTLEYYWGCVTGAPNSPTITGSFTTTGFKRTALTTDSRAIWCTQISGGYFFHSILVSESELGQSLSHGCIRLPYSAALWIYNNIFAGTRVVIYN